MAQDDDGCIAIESLAELREVLGTPGERAASKDRHRLHPLDRTWIAHSPFLLIATADDRGLCDVSPKGDPPGFVHVIDDTTLAIPERPGNKRGDGFQNILRSPQVGLLFMIPGRTDTLRVNGRARLLKEAPYFDELVVKGHRPQIAIEVSVEQIFYHCAKAFMRSKLWHPEQQAPDTLPRRPEIAHALEGRGTSLQELEEHYGARYADGLYRDPKRDA